MIALIRELNKVQYHGLNPSEAESSLLLTIARIVQSTTDADTVFVRRIQNDGSLVLSGFPLWRPGRAPVGIIPTVTQLGEGVSGWAIAMSSAHPCVVRDVRDPNDNPGAAGAHRISLKSRPKGDELTFLDFVRAEACIPLVIEGKPVAVIIAVRGEPYTPEHAEQVRWKLELLQEVLVPLYAMASAMADVDNQEDRLNQLVRAFPRIASEPDDDLFYRKFVTVLTCHKGLGWHRAMIFRFRQSYPSDAVCVMAIGSNGECEWSQVQDDLSSRLMTLEDYLRASTSDEYGFNDTLYSFARDTQWAIPWAVVARNTWLTANFDGLDPVPSVAEGILPLESDDSWIRDIVNHGGAEAFRGCAMECPHWVAPLVLPVPPDSARNGDRSRRPLGFLLLDRPYPHHVNLPRQLPLTRLVCDMFAGLIAARSGHDPVARLVAPARAPGLTVGRGPATPPM